MRFFVAVTDRKWFNYLRQRSRQCNLDEVNFWSPSARPLGNFATGTLLLFKLKRSKHIVGGGYLQRAGTSPLSWTWYAFKQANGFQNQNEFHQALNPNGENDPVRAYHLLATPFFFAEPD